MAATTKVTFANVYHDGDTTYEQGKTYEVPAPFARDLLFRGKVQKADDKDKTAKPVTTDQAEGTTAPAKSK